MAERAECVAHGFANTTSIAGSTSSVSGSYILASGGYMSCPETVN